MSTLELVMGILVVLFTHKVRGFNMNALNIMWLLNEVDCNTLIEISVWCEALDTDLYLMEETK